MVGGGNADKDKEGEGGQANADNHWQRRGGVVEYHYKLVYDKTYVEPFLPDKWQLPIKGNWPSADKR